MSAVQIVAETKETVTIRRDDWERLQGELEELHDYAAVAERRAYERLVGKENARRNYMTGEEALRLLSGESPLRVWRKKRGLSQRMLAAAAGITHGYLAEVESGRKPGSDDAFRRLSAALGVPSKELRANQYHARDPSYRDVLLRLNAISAGVSPGNRGSRADPQRFPTLGDALAFVREKWDSLRNREPWISDSTHMPIYTIEELVQAIED